jgi:hypothetical protein
MSDSEHYSESPDKVVEQTLKWKNDEDDVRASHAINLGPKKDAELDKKSTYEPGSTGWDAVNREFNLNADPEDYISVMRYEEKAGSSPTAHKVTFISETEPYTLQNRTHHVVASFKSTGGKTSTAKGIAL